MDSKFLSDISSHIQYKCKDIDENWGAPVTVRSLNLPLKIKFDAAILISGA